MKLIEWNEDVAELLTEDDKKKLFLALLGKPIDRKWEGKIKRREIVSADFAAPFIELRKAIGGANLLIRYGKRKPSRYWAAQPLPDKPVVQLSMNNTAEFDPVDFAELSIVSDEARRVYEAITK